VPDLQRVRALLAQANATLREVETAPDREVKLHRLAALEGQVGELAGALRGTRRALSAPRPGSLQGRALRLVVDRPGQLDTGILAARLRVTHQQAEDTIRNLRARGWIINGREAQGVGLLPSTIAVEVLGPPERRLR
jgi:hypothetical protein